MKITNSVSVGANASNTDVLTGTQIKDAANDMDAPVLRVALVGSATGLEAEVFAGTDVILERGDISLQNRIPIDPDDFQIDGEPIDGGPIIIKAHNTTAGALTLFYAVELYDEE